MNKTERERPFFDFDKNNTTFSPSLPPRALLLRDAFLFPLSTVSTALEARTDAAQQIRLPYRLKSSDNFNLISSTSSPCKETKKKTKKETLPFLSFLDACLPESALPFASVYTDPRNLFRNQSLSFSFSLSRVYLSLSFSLSVSHLTFPSHHFKTSTPRQRAPSRMSQSTGR